MKSIAIEHEELSIKNTTLINWCLGNTCNYSCSYCPDSLHSGSIKWVNHNLAFDFCHKIVSHFKSTGKTVEFLFTGGEPTMYPYFPMLLEKLKREECKIEVITNGSRTKKWWEQNRHLFDKVIFTYHSEFANKEHIIDIINTIKDFCSIHVNFTMLPSKFEECLETAITINRLFPNISLTLKPLLKNFGDEMYDYEERHIQVLKEIRFKYNVTENISRGSLRNFFDSGETLKYKAVDFILRNENHWKGWKCHIGIELIYIDYKGDVYRGTCKQGNKITNIHLNENFSFPNDAIICQKETCHCITDIMTTKRFN